MNLAVVGAGAWGVNLVRNFAALGVLRSVLDSDSNRASIVAAKNGASVAPSFDSILSTPSIDAVVIATPAETHYDLARQVILAGKDVYVEKPITLRYNECASLIELAADHDRIVMVGHLLKYHPAVCRLKEMVASGALGKIEYIYSNRLNLGKVRREENALWSFAPHDISVILWLLNDKMPIQVSATGGTYLQPNIADVTVTSLLFDHGVRSHVFVSWLHPFKEQKLVVIGSTAMACFDDTAKENKLRVFTKSVELSNGNFVVKPPIGTPVEYDLAEPLRSECQHFVNCVVNHVQPRTDAHDGLRVLSVLQASQRSMELNGMPVQMQASAMEPVLMS